MSESRELFDQFDEDGNGQIDLIEFRKLIAALGVELDAAATEEAFDAIDTDETGLVDYPEFQAWWDKTRV